MPETDEEIKDWIEKPEIIGIAKDVREHTITFTFDGSIMDLTNQEIVKMIQKDYVAEFNLKEGDKMKDEQARKGVELIMNALKKSNNFHQFKHNVVSALLEILREML